MLTQLLPNKRTTTFLVLLLILFFCSISLFGKYKDHNSLSVKHEENPTPYVPQISFEKSGFAVDCNTIAYTFTLKNQSTEGEIFIDVVLNDPMLGGVLNILPSGDTNLNDKLDPGETWEYSDQYNIQPTDIIAGEVTNQATVTANVEGQGVNVIENAEATVDLTNCQNPTIGIIKFGDIQDLNGDGCQETIIYMITVQNTGNMPLDQVVVTDPVVYEGNIPGPAAADDIGNDGILSPGETWNYTFNWLIDTDLLIGGNMDNQAIVNAEIENTNTQVSDFSHPDDFNSDDFTSTPVDDLDCINFAQIGLVKVSDGFVDVNQDGCDDSILYKFTVTNTGNVALYNIVIEDEDVLGLADIPGPTENSDVGMDEILSAGETWTYEALYAIKQIDIDNGSVNNQASVDAYTVSTDILIEDNSHASDLFMDGITRTPINVACAEGAGGIGLIKKGELYDLDEDGCEESILYEFTVTNMGDVDLKDIVLEDEELLGLADIPGPLDGDDIGGDEVLSVGEVWTYHAVYAITQEDIDFGSVVNQATVMGKTVGLELPVSDNSDNTDNFNNRWTRVIVTESCADGNPEIALIKTGEPIDVDEDGCFESIRYTFTVTNVGEINLHSIVVEDEDQLGLADIPGPTDGSDIGLDDILSVGEVWTYEAIYALKPDDIDAGEAINQATVVGLTVGLDLPVVDDSDFDNNNDNNETHTLVDNNFCTEGSGAIALIKTGVVQDLDEDGCDESILYTFEVRNVGDVNLKEIVVEDEDELGLPNIPGPLEGNDIGMDGILSVGEVWFYQAVYDIKQEDLDLGVKVNQATVVAKTVGLELPVADDSDHTDEFNNRPTRTEITNGCVDGGPGIGLIKTGLVIDVDQDGCDDSIRYTFRVTNTGNVALHEIIVEDQDELGLANIPGPTEGSDIGMDGMLSAGEVWTYEVLYQLTQDDIDLGEKHNQASVTALTEGLDLPMFDFSDHTNNIEDRETITLVPNDACVIGIGAIGLIKTGTPIDVNNDGCFESIRYQFKVTNIGATNLYNIVVEDEDELGLADIPGPLDGDDIGLDGMLSPNETWTFEAIYDLTQEDVDLGEVHNQASVTALTVGYDLPVSDLSDHTNTVENRETVTMFNEACIEGAANMYLLKTGDLVDVNGDGCSDSILYRFELTNNGDVDIIEISLEDEFIDPDLIGLLPESDTNNDGILSVGETWFYEALYALTPEDLDTGEVSNRALASGLVDQTNIPITDYSHETTIDDDGFTITLVPAGSCLGDAIPRITLIKTATLSDLDDDGCPESIDYTFSVSNLGDLDLRDVVISDAELFTATISVPVSATDTNNDEILSVGETWTFEVNYSLTPDDIDSGIVTNSATVSANLVNVDVSVWDTSDDNSPDENDPTQTLIPSDICDNTGPIEAFEIFNGITPNNDGINDYFQINGIEIYPNNNLKIFNRWGVLIYEADGYGLDSKWFYGVSEGRATLQKDRELPSGTYFYILSFTGDNPGESSYSGYLYINRD
ncbi:gliding motility-associated C-terminal domain-containing protein [Flagellimonas zhangzhouensis]|uniref:Conserved repeat domain-containing protein/gliding motility-associated C-terminal domain-containing protein n=1 Tax=Flagellimonas zhangzhouensis TaxID=1073328 RepID=A0A1H2SST9_9FLAO|nr:gliding motility-associated C-terminal domain-containing protein [Allomuricauda zhangzhouensis]SDQ78689.1 conserved repeat domain-containing protein/gliding motility-associated C-terminal domain-containing protein [Allomuricauda zhangzhouensis]SDW34525.1 conserved repeat domain-containing protein/gliding motility-associated C-terminal domain-containing protein [Allomuricauda zhangzhouensis]